MDKKPKWLLLLLIVIAHKCPRRLAAELFEDQPKILVNDGNLVFESAESKNISIKLRGKSRFLIDEFDVLKLLAANSSSISSGSDSGEIDGLRDEVKRLRNMIRGRDGILKRLERLEDGNPPSSSNRNSTTNSTGGGGSGMSDRRRIMALQRRVVTLENRVANLTDRLTKDHCKSYPCQNGGTCFNMFDTFRCECPKSWEGPTCSLDVDECSRYLGTEFACQNEGTCINKPGAYECICKDPWKGQLCAQKTVDCMNIPNSEICGHGTCVQAKSKLGYTCICENGWRASNVTLACNVDIDECAEMRPHCSNDPKVQCYNTPGSFICGACPAGYTGNGYTCVDVNECEINNGGCSTSPRVECINTRGSSRCANCPLGYDGDGRICLPSTRPDNQCSDDDKKLCSVNAQCFKRPNTPPDCICNFGFTGSGFGVSGCSALNLPPCSLKCQNGGLCKQTIIANGSIQEFCDCPRGTIAPLCERRNPCSPNPCSNEGNCTSIAGGRRYKCDCINGFKGVNCQTQIVSKCDIGLKTGDNGTIAIPLNGMSAYDHNMKCAWRIQVNRTKVINVTFNKFHVEKSADCRFDWLQIHDGANSAAQLIGRFCGSELPKGGNLISTHNQLYLWFRSDNNTSHAGFDLTWQAVDPVCGGEINATSHGIIASPGSPGQYPLNRTCNWIITAPPSKRIQFLFYNLNIESHPTCDYDFVEIFARTNASKTSLGKFCNTTEPPPKILTPDNVATIVFHSDGSGTDYGFQLTYSVQEGMPGCGGIYTASKGDITSPIDGVEGKYKHNIVCDYIIQMPPLSRVRVVFDKFKLESSSDCKFDRVELIEGDAYDESKLIGKFCGEKLPPAITSLTNHLTLRFATDWTTSNDGFHAKYSIVCGGTYTADNGNISSPNYPNPYNGDRTCEYDIVAPEGKVIIFSVLDLDVEKHSVCDFDNLEIFDFPTADNSTSLGRFCGQVKPGTLTSSYNHLHIHFSADASINGRGFFANYSFVDVSCGGVISDASKVIRSPMSTDATGVYKSNSNCRWVVVAPRGFVIQMNFINFELESDAECKYDYVKVFNNASGKGEAMGPFCGTNAPKVITTIDNIATVLFHTDSSTGKEGFTITLSFIDGNKLCGANYFSSTGLVRSPNALGEYLPNKECEWIINVKRGQQIELTFNYFDIEQHTTCKFDGLEIRNGGNSLAPLIGKFCGPVIPPPIRSFGNQLYLKFTSDSSRNGKGFEAQWDGALSGCGGVITSSKGSIASPQHPLAYPHNARCEWRISVSEGSTIEIIFTDLDFETQQQCKYDYLEIFDGFDAASTSLGRFCSSENHPMNLVSSNNHAFIRMNTDESHANRGFYLKYKTNCNRTIMDTSGVVESPNFPEQYPGNTDCAWTIVVPKGNQIHMQFSHFEMENEGVSNGTNGHICKYDYVEIYDLDLAKKSPKGQKLKYCNHAPEVRNSTTDAVVITFHSDPSTHGMGFRLEWYLIGCGGKITGRQVGELLSPNYPNQYQNSLTCFWEIEVDYGYDIEVSVNHLDIEHHTDCEYDSLSFATDRNFNQTLTKLCDMQDTHKTHFTTHGHILFVKFDTDDTSGKAGFNVTYRRVPSSCGGMFESRQGVISTRNYPKQNYEDMSICEWDIKTDISHSLVLTLLEFDLEDSNGCTKDKLEIIDTVFNRTLWIGCGALDPNRTVFGSQRNELLVRLTTDDTISAKGFKANFTQSCGSRIIVDGTGSMDFVKSTNEMHCVWTFIAKDPSKKVTLTFTNARIRSTDIGINCTTQVMVFDGDSVDGPMRVKFCDAVVVPAIVSNGNALTVSIFMLIAKLNTALRVTYSSMDNYCGAEYTRTFAGEFASPLYPASSPLGISCEWRVAASAGNRITLSVKSIDIAASPGCDDNYLEIRENDRSGALVGVFCGNQIPASLNASQSFWIKYQTDAMSTNNGFLAAFTYNYQVDLSGKSGTIESPWYPNYESSNRNFYYRITVSQGSVIRFEFPDFYMENDEEDAYVDSDEDTSQESLSCSNYLRFHDGFDTDSPVLGDDVCMQNPNVLTSSTNVVYVIANLDGRFKYRITWKEVAKVVNSSVTFSRCGDYALALTNVTQQLNITSPGFPNGYDIGMECTWTVTSALPGYHPRFYFNRLDLDDGTSCIGDYVKISSDREDSTWKQMGRYCNLETQGQQRYFDGTPNLRIEFHSDYYQNRTGFNGTVGLVCGGVMNEPEGVIEYSMSPMYAFQLVYDCMWNITVARGRRIKFEFTRFNILNSTANGCDSYLTIRNGIDASSPYLGVGKYCGNQLPTDIPETSSNRAFVKLHITMNLYAIQHTNFTLKYSEVRDECGGTIRLTGKNSSRIISTPNYPNIPHPHSECLWTIMAPTGERVKIDFIERFDLKPSRNCSDEFVELKDGGTSVSPMIGSFCGLRRPRTLKTKSNILNLKFFTDSGDPGNGFKANVSIDICGGEVLSRSGIINSPRYPGLGAYPYNAQCDYRVVWLASTVFNITFDDLNLPPKNGSECDKKQDYLEIFSVLPDDNSTDGENLISEGVFCGDKVPSDALLSMSSTVLFRFQTFQKTSKLYKGFKVSYSATATSCGGSIDAESGAITSPNYPAKSLSVTHCEWRITTTKGNRIVAEFEDIDIAPPVRLFTQKISLMNDQRVPIVSITMNSTTGPFYSSDNVMIVSFYVRLATLNRGFKLKFRSEKSTICVGDLNQSEGSLKVPNEVPVNETNASFHCKFNRDTAPIYDNHHEKGTIAYYFNDIKAGRIFGNCRGAPNGINVMRRSGIDDDEKYLGRICGNSSSTITVVSPFPDVTIEAKKSYSFFGDVNFNMNYKTHKCGGKLLGGNSKIVKTASSIVSNEKVVDCAWYIKLQQGFSVKALFKKLELKQPCDNEWITIYNGPSQVSPVLGKYCGNQFSSDKIVTDSNSMFIVYHSDDFVGVAKNSLFELDMETATAGCGGALTASTRVFSSPLYDGGKTLYPANTECIWDITAQPHFHIGLEFIDRFSIQSSDNCSNDFVEVFDYGDNGEWQSMGRVCGREHPKPFNTTSNRMRVIFHSDGTVSGDGFKATWRQNCGGVYPADKVKRVLSSPGYPLRYGKLLRCNYTITAPVGKFINVKFLDFKLEDRCGYDNLTMSKKQLYVIPTALEKVGTFCGLKNPGKYRLPEMINFMFYSDMWIERQGWSLEYAMDDCGGEVKESGLIASPEIIRDPMVYLGQMNCYWNITAPKDDKIIIRFQKFVLETSDTCMFDAVDVYNGTSTNDSMRLARLCGNLTGTLKPLVINQNQAIIRLKTDQTANFDGFSAEIIMRPKCDKRVQLSIEKPEIVIDETNKNFNVENECNYQIIGEPLDVLHISFEQIHLSPCDPDITNDTCSCDYLDILDGNGPYSPEIRRVCGHDIPGAMTTSKNSVFIRFVTDSVRPSTGFKMRIKRIASMCGNMPVITLHGNETQPFKLFSPSRDRKYLPNMNCMWTFKAPYNKIFDIRFEKFELENSTNCEKDYLSIEDESMKNYIIEGLGQEFIFRGKSFQVRSPNFYSGISGPVAPHIYCGSGAPVDYLSSSPNIHVHFQSDSEVEMAGFDVTIRLLESCSRNFTALQGRLLSTQDPITTCKSTIKVPENYTISLFFAKFYMFESDCTKSFLKVYDGSFDDGALIATHCGYVVPNPIFSTKNQLSLIFHFGDSTAVYSKGSYDLMYLATDKGQGCGGEILNYGGIFTSPMYPNNVRTMYDCTWSVTVPQNLKVAMRFSVFDMGTKLTCASDYVEFLEENEAGEVVSLRKYCGEDDPQIYVSSKSKVRVHYVQTVNFSGTGWTLQFMGIHEGSDPQNW